MNANKILLSQGSYNLLKHISKHPNFSPAEDSVFSMDCLQQLCEYGLIFVSVNTIFVNSFDSVSSYSITELGKGYLRYRKNELLKEWIPYIITTCISVLSLMKSYGHGIDDIIIWCMQQLAR